MYLETRGQAGELVGQPLQLGNGHMGIGRVGPLGIQERCPVHRQLAGDIGQHRVAGMTTFVQRRTVGLDHFFRLFGLHDALRDQAIGIELARTRMLGDFLVHQRLGDEGLVLLVVSEFAETDDVDHHILLELHAVVECQLRHELHRFRVVAIDMENRRFDHFCNVSAISGGACIARIGGSETYLVVDNDMHRAASAVAPRVGEVQGFHDHALACECSIAMHQDRQHLVASVIATATLTCLDRTLHYRVDDFQVRRIEGQADMHRTTRRGDIG